jgi:hypothetical protein
MQKCRTSPKNPILRNWSVLDLSLIIFGGEGGVVFVFCLGNGGDGGWSVGFLFTFSFAGVAGLLTALVKG